VSSLGASASTKLERRLEAALTRAERIRIGVDLGSALLALGLLVLAFTWQLVSDSGQRPLVEALKAIAALIVSGPVFVQATRGLLRPTPTAIIDQLVALAVLAALVSGEFTTAVLVPVILNLSHMLEERSILGARDAIEGLRTLHARRATLLTPSGEREVEPAALQPGDLLLIRPGDVLPADGEIRKGNSTVDQSSITGESLAEEVGPGMRLFAGSVNLTGVLELKVTGVGEQTALGRVLDLLRGAEASKTPIVRLLEQYAGYYVPMILMIAAVVLFVTREMSRAVAVLVVACPGAFILAGPTAMIAALAVASRLGILIKNSKFLEALADVDTVILDKTGTVTLGHLEVVSSQPVEGIDERAVLATAARCAVGSRHPVSRAVLAAARAAGVAPTENAREVEESAGRGMTARGDGVCHRLGKADWLRELGLTLPADPDHAGPVVWVARDHRVLGCILLADLPRPEAAASIAELRALGAQRVVLLTGDRRQVARQVAGMLGIEEVLAEVLPEQKLQAVQTEKDAGRSVMVVGDGVNDALALASGDVGVAMGAMGSDVALRSADVALMTNDLGRLPLAVQLSRRTRRTIHQNLLIGAGTSVLMLALASLGLISPIAGAILHNVGEIYILFNSAQLLGFARPARSARTAPADGPSRVIDAPDGPAPARSAGSHRACEPGSQAPARGGR
jgi:heavy metal translocating P-type ATPase